MRFFTNAFIERRRNGKTPADTQVAAAHPNKDVVSLCRSRRFRDTLTICNWAAIVGRQATDLGKPTDLVQGTLDLLILKIVSLEPKHGWALARRIQQISNEALQVQQGSLYPALYRLEQQRVDEGPLAPNGDRASSKVLLADSCRPKAARRRTCELGSLIERD
jgi:hypothetical protein